MIVQWLTLISRDFGKGDPSNWVPSIYYNRPLPGIAYVQCLHEKFFDRVLPKTKSFVFPTTRPQSFFQNKNFCFDQNQFFLFWKKLFCFSKTILFWPKLFCFDQNKTSLFWKKLCGRVSGKTKAFVLGKTIVFTTTYRFRFRTGNNITFCILTPFPADSEYQPEGGTQKDKKR